MRAPHERTARRLSYLPYLVFTACALIYFLPFIRLLPQHADEGTLLYGAVRVTEGQVPLRDFFEVMGPGSFYWLALFFKLLGTSFLSARISFAITSLSTALLMYFLARRLKTGNYAAQPALFLATSFGPLWPAVSHHNDSNLFALISFTAFVLWTHTRRPILLSVAGALAGVTTCFMQPKGILLFLSFIALTFLLRSQGKLSALLACLAAGYLAIAIIILFLYWRAEALPDLIYASFLWPLTRYSAANHVPYAYGILKWYWSPWVDGLRPVASPVIAFSIATLLLTPFLLIAALPGIAAVAALRYKALSEPILPYWGAGTALWLSEIHRKDVTHLASGSPLLIIVAFCLLGRVRHRLCTGCVQMACFLTFSLLIFNLFIALAAGVSVETPRGTIYVARPDPVLEFVTTHIEPGQEIFAYPYCPIYYFLTGARNATRYSILMYNINTESQFRDAIRSLEEKKVRYVIWDRGFSDGGARFAWPSYSPPPTDRLIIEPYLSEHYRVLRSMDRTDILERRAQTPDKAKTPGSDYGHAPGPTAAALSESIRAQLLRQTCSRNTTR